MDKLFLQAYRDLEQTLLQKKQLSVIDYENSLDDNKREKLKCCRIMRNYMSHNDLAFLNCSQAQIDFLTSLTDELNSDDLVQTKMIKPKLIDKKTNIKDLYKLILKYNILPIDTGSSIYLIDKNILIKNLSENNRKITIPKRLPTYHYCKKNDVIKDLKYNCYIVTSDGTKDSKYLGIYISH